MKIGILTYYGVHNHGAVLQANALKTVLEQDGHSVEFLTFKRNYDLIPAENEKKYNISLSSIGFYFKYLFQNGVASILYNVKKRNILNNYRNQNIKLGARYSDFRGDAVIIGSDEVFSFEVGINPFFFGHGVKTDKIISYGACFGPTTCDYLKENNLTSLVSSGLGTMQCVGVRDMNTKHIADSLGNKPAVLVCDPVILYGYENEQKAALQTREKYVLIYSYDKNMNEDSETNTIIQYARQNNLKVYSVGYYHKWCDKNINVSPNELLGYIKNAQMVITDTFHGSVLSIVCNTPFAVKLRGNSNKLGFLLQEYELEDRIIDSFDQINTVCANPIDFGRVNSIVATKRKLSLAFLKNSLAE